MEKILVAINDPGLGCPYIDKAVETIQFGLRRVFFIDGSQAPIIRRLVGPSSNSYGEKKSYNGGFKHHAIYFAVLSTFHPLLKYKIGIHVFLRRFETNRIPDRYVRHQFGVLIKRYGQLKTRWSLRRSHGRPTRCHRHLAQKPKGGNIPQGPGTTPDFRNHFLWWHEPHQYLNLSDSEIWKYQFRCRIKAWCYIRNVNTVSLHRRKIDFDNISKDQQEVSR